MTAQARAFAAGTAFGALLAASIAGVAQMTSGGAERAAAERAAASGQPLVELRKLGEAFGAIRKNYAAEVDDRVLVDGCIAGMLRRLDPQSAYLDAGDFRELMTGGQRGGLGVELTTFGERIRVIAPLEGTPAERAGVSAGDYIVKVNDTETTGLAVADVVKLLVGPPGSPVTLTLARAGGAEPIMLTLTREVIKVQEVRSKLAAPGVGFVRISQFRETTPEAFARTLGALRGENGAPLKGLVLDLRGNPGGLLQSAIAVAAAFLDQDRVVLSMKGRNADSNRQFTANPRDYETGAAARGTRVPLPEDTRTLPLAVLVDRASAAGSEIVAGSLQDYRRATIVGEKTFGRGSIQTIMPMGDNTALKLTTAYWYTPNGRAIHAQGIAPDVALDPAAAGPEAALNYGNPADPGLRRALEILQR
ncbi:MAG TPA: S41 family peptidase [Burkholderiales bacterium]|nr:S41 family peptidase [Burkholderiales bacterium]